MIWPLVVVAAVLLAVERIAYVMIWRYSEPFSALSATWPLRWLGGPVEVVRAVFVVCKAIQAAVFVSWIYLHAGAGGDVVSGSWPIVAAGCLVVVAGQVLNFGVFLRLGTTGVFYGNRFGHDVAWCQAFPFSLLAHPQYVGTVMSIWGLFLITRFPHIDWYVLPMLETAYYGIGAKLEQ